MQSCQLIDRIQVFGGGDVILAAGKKDDAGNRAGHLASQAS